MATISADPGTLEQILWHGQPLTTATATITGDRQAAERFLAMFPLPELTTGRPPSVPPSSPPHCYCFICTAVCII